MKNTTRKIIINIIKLKKVKDFLIEELLFAALNLTILISFDFILVIIYLKNFLQNFSDFQKLLFL